MVQASKQVSSSGVGTVWKWSKTQIESHPPSSAARATLVMVSNCSMGSSISARSIRQPCGTKTPNLIAMVCSSPRSLRSVPKISQKRGRLGQRFIVGARDPALDAEESVVAGLFERGEARKEVEVPFTRLEAVAVGDVDVDDVMPGRPYARRDVRLLDVHVEEIRHDRNPSPDPLGEFDALLQPVDEVLLVAVEWLEEDRYAGVPGRWRELFELLDEQLTFELGSCLVRSQVGQSRRGTELWHCKEADGAECGCQVQPPAHQFLPRSPFGRV